MPSRSSCAWAAVAAVLLAGPAGADEPPAFRVRLPGARRAARVRTALQVAHERLAHPECQRLFTDFADQAGRPLQHRLDTLGLTGQQFLTYVGFYEGYAHTACRREFVMAFTQPGSLAVRVCPGLSELDGERASVIVLHEMLHALGLGERPPSSLAITSQVEKRCGAKALSVRTARR